MRFTFRPRLGGAGYLTYLGSPTSSLQLHVNRPLICENQTLWRLEILLRTIVAALLKTKDIKKRARNISEQCKWKYSHKYFSAGATFDAWSCPPHPPNKHGTHTNKKGTVCLMTSAHPTSNPHNLFSNSYHDKCTSFLITQLPKKKRKFIP